MTFKITNVKNGENSTLLIKNKREREKIKKLLKPKLVKIMKLSRYANFNN